MRRNVSVVFATIFWFSVIAQFVLMVQNRTASIPETVIRFFSFFTILTNTLAALYFSSQALANGKATKPGTLTALTVYITMVGLVYQILLRSVWNPTGMQQVVDELLHTINPVLVILFWFLFEEKKEVGYRQIKTWLVYPLVYIVYILIRGSFSGFYPYPFVNVIKIGLSQTIVNSSLLLLFAIVIACLFVSIGRSRYVN